MRAWMCCTNLRMNETVDKVLLERVEHRHVDRKVLLVLQEGLRAHNVAQEGERVLRARERASEQARGELEELGVLLVQRPGAQRSHERGAQRREYDVDHAFELCCHETEGRVEGGRREWVERRGEERAGESSLTYCESIAALQAATWRP